MGEKGKKILITLVFCGILICSMKIGEKIIAYDPYQKGISEKILRFHVKANSDSKKDQEVKLLVRDAIGLYMGEQLKDAKSLAESEAIVLSCIPEIEETAREVIKQEGYTYGVKASLGDRSFPKKCYGPFTFPAGTYRALEVQLGEAKGKNWWCVLFPELCFQGSVYEVEEENASKSLREVLSPEEFRDVFDGGHFEIHFKFLEYFLQNE